MLGAQAARADRSMMRRMLSVAAVVFTACATRSCRRLLAVRLPRTQQEARPACWVRRWLMPMRSCVRLLAVRSHGRHQRHALNAGRAGGSRGQINDGASAQRGRSGLHSLRHALVPAPARGAAPRSAAGGTPCMLGAQAAQAHAFVRAPARSALPWPMPEACSPCWARWRLVPQSDGEANAQRGRSGLHSLRHAFVPAPALSAAPRSAAGDTPCMLGAQAAHARAFYVRLLAVRSHGRRRRHVLHAGHAGSSCRQVRLVGKRSWWPRWSSQPAPRVRADACSQCGSHARSRCHALHAGRAGGSCRQDR